MYEGLSDQSIALKNGVGDIAAMAKSSFVHTPKNKRYVKCSSGEQEWIMVITDNGQTTEKDVKEGGGLSGIRKRVEQCGGTLRICAESKFSIIVKIPKEVRR